jgi:GNAT superfamily N-acetyltransferase
VTADLSGGAVYRGGRRGRSGCTRLGARSRPVAPGIVFVRPRARRRGVAKALVAACAEELGSRGAVRLSLDVIPTNTRAREVW